MECTREPLRYRGLEVSRHPLRGRRRFETRRETRSTTDGQGTGGCSGGGFGRKAVLVLSLDFGDVNIRVDRNDHCFSQSCHLAIEVLVGGSVTVCQVLAFEMLKPQAAGHWIEVAVCPCLDRVFAYPLTVDGVGEGFKVSVHSHDRFIVFSDMSYGPSRERPATTLVLLPRFLLDPLYFGTRFFLASALAGLLGFGGLTDL